MRIVTLSEAFPAWSSKSQPADHKLIMGYISLIPGFKVALSLYSEKFPSKSQFADYIVIMEIIC
jgi:hypothetical protein